VTRVDAGGFRADAGRFFSLLVASECKSVAVGRQYFSQVRDFFFASFISAAIPLVLQISSHTEGSLVEVMKSDTTQSSKNPTLTKH
jgi:hypothetical protein